MCKESTLTKERIPGLRWNTVRGFRSLSAWNYLHLLPIGIMAYAGIIPNMLYLKNALVRYQPNKGIQMHKGQQGLYRPRLSCDFNASCNTCEKLMFRSKAAALSHAGKVTVLLTERFAFAKRMEGI